MHMAIKLISLKKYSSPPLSPCHFPWFPFHAVNYSPKILNAKIPEKQFISFKLDTVAVPSSVMKSPTAWLSPTPSCPRHEPSLCLEYPQGTYYPPISHSVGILVIRSREKDHIRITFTTVYYDCSILLLLWLISYCA